MFLRLSTRSLNTIITMIISLKTLITIWCLFNINWQSPNCGISLKSMLQTWFTLSVLVVIKLRIFIINKSKCCKHMDLFCKEISPSLQTSANRSRVANAIICFIRKEGTRYKRAPVGFRNHSWFQFFKKLDLLLKGIKNILF